MKSPSCLYRAAYLAGISPLRSGVRSNSSKQLCPTVLWYTSIISSIDRNDWLTPKNQRSSDCNVVSHSAGQKYGLLGWPPSLLTPLFSDWCQQFGHWRMSGRTHVDQFGFGAFPSSVPIQRTFKWIVSWTSAWRFRSSHGHTYSNLKRHKCHWYHNRWIWLPVVDMFPRGFRSCPSL